MLSAMATINGRARGLIRSLQVTDPSGFFRSISPLLALQERSTLMTRSTISMLPVFKSLCPVQSHIGSVRHPSSDHRVRSLIENGRREPSSVFFFSQNLDMSPIRRVVVFGAGYFGKVLAQAL